MAAIGILLMALTNTRLAAAAPPDASAQTLRDLAETQNYTLGSPINARPTPDGKAVLFLRSGPRDRVRHLYEMDVADGKTRELLTPAEVLGGASEHLSAAEKARRERQRQTARGFASFTLSDDGASILLPLSGKLYVVRRADRHVTELAGDDWLDARFSPSGEYVGGVLGNEVQVVNVATGKRVQLTHGATETLTHGVAEFVAQEEMDRFTGFWWSPDSQSIAYEEADLSPVDTLYIPDPASPNAAPAAFRYPRAGTANANVRLGIVGVNGGPTRWVTWDTAKYPYLCRVVWKEKRAPLTVTVMNRAQQEEAVLAADAASGATRLLLVERDPAWLNLDRDNAIPRWLPSGNGFLWTTERGGDWQVERRAADGRFVHALTPAGFHYTGIADIDERDGTAVVSGGPDAREEHLYRVRLEGTGSPVQITQGRGVHSGTFSDNHAVWVHHASLLDGTTVSEVRDAQNKTLAALPSVAETPPFLPQVELTEAGDNPTFDAAIVRPRAFDAHRRYPVILDVYAGPTVKTVQAVGRSYLSNQWMADQGYIVVSLDGRGTPGKGRAWERAIQGNLIDIALQDQASGLKALGTKYPEMDVTRVGVTGWSFGGYFTAMATMRRPDVFACGVSGAPVTDWSLYDTFYTERYLGLPSANPDGYQKSSALTYAGELAQPLLLVHGVTDDNVYFVNSLRLAEALFEAGKPFEFLPMSGTHMAGAEDPTQGERLWGRIMGFSRRIWARRRLEHQTGVSVHSMWGTLPRPQSRQAKQGNKRGMRARQDSNLRPPAPQAGALIH